MHQGREISKGQSGSSKLFSSWHLLQVLAKAHLARQASSEWSHLPYQNQSGSLGPLRDTWDQKRGWREGSDMCSLGIYPTALPSVGSVGEKFRVRRQTGNAI